MHLFSHQHTAHSSRRIVLTTQRGCESTLVYAIRAVGTVALILASNDAQLGTTSKNAPLPYTQGCELIGRKPPVDLYPCMGGPSRAHWVNWSACGVSATRGTKLSAECAQISLQVCPISGSFAGVAGSGCNTRHGGSWFVRTLDRVPHVPLGQERAENNVTP